MCCSKKTAVLSLALSAPGTGCWRAGAPAASTATWPAGPRPDATVPLALRAQLLVRGPARRDLARSASRVLAAATQAPAAGRLPVPVRRDQVRDCSAEFTELIGRLLAAGPVPAQGVAMARILLTDASGPLYHRAGGGELRASVRDAADALGAPLIPRPGSG